MATYGIIGDIHGNLEGLQAVLAELQRRRVSDLLCIGDVIGYNADSNECVALVRQRGIRTIAGNHDLIGIRRLGFERCSNKARYSLTRTREQLSQDSIAWLASLPDNLLVDDQLALIHGGVRDVQLYMRTPSLVRLNVPLLRMDFPTARICFFGHCHEQKVYEVCGEEVADVTGARVRLSRERTYFINPGSVDAQRKPGSRLAEFAVFDSDLWEVEFVTVPYHDELTESKAIGQGFRIGALMDRWYTLRRRAANKLARVGARFRGQRPQG